MKTKSLVIRKVNFLVCLLVVFLVAACSPSQPVQDVREADPATADIPEEEVPVEPVQEEAATAEPVDPPAAPPSDGVVWMEDLIYPGAEFLLEVDGFGGPMTPWRFYAVHNISGDELANYYKQQLNWFTVENDETIDGIRYLMLAHPEPLGFMNNAEDFEAISQAMDGSLLGLEVTHSDAGAGLNRLGMAIDMHDIADQIPPNTTIIILDYYQNIY